MHVRPWAAPVEHALLHAPPGARARAGRQLSDVPPAVNLSGCPSQMYTTSVRVGAEEFEAVVDTGSSPLLLVGADCIGCDSNARGFRVGPGAVDLGMKQFLRYGEEDMQEGAALPKGA